MKTLLRVANLKLLLWKRAINTYPVTHITCQYANFIAEKWLKLADMSCLRH